MKKLIILLILVVFVIAGVWAYVFYTDYNDYHILIYFEGRDAFQACDKFQFDDHIDGHSILHLCSPGSYQYELLNKPYLEVTIFDFGGDTYFTHQRDLKQVLDTLHRDLEASKTNYQYNYQIVVKKQNHGFMH